MKKLTAQRVSTENQRDLSDVYKTVFSCFPWYEKRICSGAR